MVVRMVTCRRPCARRKICSLSIVMINMDGFPTMMSIHFAEVGTFAVDLRISSSDACSQILLLLTLCPGRMVDNSYLFSGFAKRAYDILNQAVDGCLSPNALMIDDCGDVIISALPPSLLRKDTKVLRQKGWSQLGYIPTIQTREAR
jgi:hypothetical protein